MARPARRRSAIPYSRRRYDSTALHEYLRQLGSGYKVRVRVQVQVRAGIRDRVKNRVMNRVRVRG
jgi:hypothetical protein